MSCFEYDDWSLEHDCRDKLIELKQINPAFKVSLFTVPAKTTMEMIKWAFDNQDWVELCYHGWTHEPNTECADWTFDYASNYFLFMERFGLFFKRIMRAPGWQISDDCYVACIERGVAVADQPYNRERRPANLFVYEVGDDDYHGHCFDCGCNNGIYEDWENIVNKVKQTDKFEFVSERLE